jgi:phosphate transport system substrate-binding protein
MDEEELKRARETGGEVVHIPLILGAVVPAYNLEEVKEPIQLSSQVLADIFLGKIKRWNARAIKLLNPKAALPDKEITVVHRLDSSGTTYVWVDYLARVSPEWETRVGVGKTVKWPCGEAANGNSGVARLVKQTPGSLGYVELTYSLQEGLPFAAVENKEGVFVKANPASVRAAADNALSRIPDDLRYSLNNAPGTDSYPICGTVWAVLYVNQPEPKGKLVVDFLRWATHEGQSYATEMSYVPLPPALLSRVEAKLDQIRVGS